MQSLWNFDLMVLRFFCCSKLNATLSLLNVVITVAELAVRQSDFIAPTQIDGEGKFSVIMTDGVGWIVIHGTVAG